MTLPIILILATLVIVGGIECVLAIREDNRLSDLEEWNREYPTVRFRSTVRPTDYPPVVAREDSAWLLDTEDGPSREAA